MGDYAAVKFYAVLSELGVNVVQRLHRLGQERESAYEDPWVQVFDEFGQLKRPIRYLASSRSSHIPFGYLQFHPRDWPQENLCELEDGVWKVVCSTKDAPSIYWFFHEVLSQLIKGPAVGYHWYELEQAPWAYVIEPGEGVTSVRMLEDE